MSIRALVVDDSFFMRKVISDILSAGSDIEVVGQASDGAKALEVIRQLQPDVVTLDNEMPGMDGLETLKKIMELSEPPPTVIVSGYAQEGSDLAFKCLSAGAIDIVLKPGGSISLEMEQVGAELRKKVTLAAGVDTQKVKHLVAAKGHRSAQLRQGVRAGHGVLVIGSSTGGPAALEQVLPQIPENFPYPVVVAQHLPGTFAPYFIQRLGSLCVLPVVEAESGLAVTPGTIYVAKGGTLTEVTARADGAHFAVRPDPTNFESPSVSKLLSSAAEVYRDKTIGVILTGMGHDGLTGAETVKQHGGQVFVQDEATSVVYGMGRTVSEAHLADEVLPLTRIIPKVVSALAV